MAKGYLQRLYERRALAFNRKAVAHGARGRVSADELAVMPLTCHYCERALDHTGSDFDHLIPFAREGTNTIDNIVRACGSCNGRKFTKLPEEHRAYTEKTWICPVCGKGFRPRYSDWQNGNGKVCSRKCAGTRSRMNVGGS